LAKRITTGSQLFFDQSLSSSTARATSQTSAGARALIRAGHLQSRTWRRFLRHLPLQPKLPEACHQCDLTERITVTLKALRNQLCVWFSLSGENSIDHIGV
jgi:hypothetical protein